MVAGSTLQFVTGPITLIAFVIWVVFSAKMVRAKQQTQVLEAAVEQGNVDIVQIVSETLPEGERLAVRLSALPTENERLTLLSQFMDQRKAAQRSKFQLSLVFLILSILSFAFVSYIKETPVPTAGIEGIERSATAVSVLWVSSPGALNSLTAVLNDAAGAEQKAIELSGETGKVSFSNLEPAQKYSVHLVVKDLFGRGETIGPIEFVTHASHNLIGGDGQWKVYYTGVLSNTGEVTSDDGLLEYIDTWSEDELWVFRGVVREGLPGGEGVLSLRRGGLSYTVTSFEEYQDDVILGHSILDFTTDEDKIYFPQVFPLWNDFENEGYGGGGSYVNGSYRGPFLLKLWRSPTSQANSNNFRLGPFVATPHGEGRISWSLPDNTGQGTTCGFWEGNFESGMLKGIGRTYSFRPIDEGEALREGEFDFTGAGNNVLSFFKNGEFFYSNKSAFLHNESRYKNGALISTENTLSSVGTKRLGRFSC